ncbi:MAG: energy transducer TonB [Acidobacteria bacterium]|nr:energy transducer TonB [Acidobacteriota bacterium]
MSRQNVLSGCLVESDPVMIARARQAKRRTLLVAVILQVLLVGLLVLAPLLGAAEKLSARIITPTVPYKGSPKRSEVVHEKQRGQHKPPVVTSKSGLIAPTHIPPQVADIHDPPDAFTAQQEPIGSGTGIGRPDGVIDLDAPSDRRPAIPKPPEAPAPKPKGPVVVPPAVQEARLIFRVQPIYPPLPRSAGIEGKVVLRAVIAKDGTIQSLETVSGNPLFIIATREAILRWRYQPTLLHGEPVEVETVITVVFTLRR